MHISHRWNHASKTLALAVLLIASTGTFAAQATGPSPSSEAKSQPAISEDLSTPALADSHLTAEPATITGSYEETEFTRQTIRLQWRPSDPIDLYVVRPAGVAKPPVVLYLFNYLEGAQSFRNRFFCRFLARNGYAAVGFSPAFTLERNHGAKDALLRAMPEALAKSAHDVQMVLDYLKTRDDLDMGRLGVYGEGSGGTIAILAAAVDSRIKALDVLDPWGDWPDWLAQTNVIPEKERATYLKPELVNGMAAFDPTQWLPKLKTGHVRLQEIETTPGIPQSVRDKLASAAPTTAEVVRYPDRGAYNAKVEPAKKSYEWIKQALQGN